MKRMASSAQRVRRRNLFFSWADLHDVSFDALEVGRPLKEGFLGTNFKGECTTNVLKLQGGCGLWVVGCGLWVVDGA